jgi:hypothetical protein
MSSTGNSMNSAKLRGRELAEKLEKLKETEKSKEKLGIKVGGHRGQTWDIAGTSGSDLHYALSAYWTRAEEREETCGR